MDANTPSPVQPWINSDEAWSMQKPAVAAPIGVEQPKIVEAVFELVPAAKTERGHHRFGASRLPYLGICPGFTSEGGEKEAAIEGTALHDIMEAVVRRWMELRDAGTVPAALTTVLDTVISEGNPVDDDNYEHLRFCCDAIAKWLYSPKVTKVVVELEVAISNPDGSNLNFGYLDVLVFFGDTHGVLSDYKFGWIPVKPAVTNEQGMDYVLACFQKFPKLQVLGCEFIQPKLHRITQHVFYRKDIPELYKTIKSTIDRAIIVQSDFQKYAGSLKVNDACAYCKHAATCPAGLQETLALARRMPDLPKDLLPSLDAIQTPEQAALVRYAVERVEDFLEGVKSRTKEIAIANGDAIEAKLPSGELVRYEIQHQRVDRQLGETSLIVEALEPIIDQRQLMAAAEFSIGKLEKIVGDAIQENNNLPIETKLADLAKALEGEVLSGSITKTEAKKRLAEAKKASKKMTKDDAKAAFCSLLEAQGLLSRPDTRIPVMRRKKYAKELPENTETK